MNLKRFRLKLFLVLRQMKFTKKILYFFCGVIYNSHMKNMKKLVIQFAKFGVAGFFSFLIDYGLLVLLTELTPLEYFASSAISYTVSVLFNYILSLKFVFDVKEDRNRIKDILVFTFLGIVGLGLTQMIMWICVEKLLLFYAVAKMLATLVVSTYNFISRKMLLE